MCNTRTGTALELVSPFVIETCGECGHIHRISDKPKRVKKEPIMLPFWRYCGSLLLLLLCSIPVSAQSSLALPTEGERHAADVASYLTYAASAGMALADCRHDGQWDRTCLVRLGVKNGTSILLTEALKRLIHEKRPCEPNCGIDTGSGSFPSGHSISFVNVDPWGHAHLGLSVEFTVASATAAERVLAFKHWSWDAVGSALLGQGINAATRRIIQ